VSEDISFDEIKKLQEMKAVVSGRIASELGIAARITLVERRTFSDTDGTKRKLVVDNRK